jgi:hypothetical protein
VGELIQTAENYLESRLTKKEVDSITEQEVPDFDFYSIQCWCDGFGNDGYTSICFKTKEEAEEYIKKNKDDLEDEVQIVGQWFGKTYRNYW